MVGDNKDRLGDKLHDVEAAREDQWARKRDDDLIEKMRERLSQHACPELQAVPGCEDRGAVCRCMRVPQGHGAWLDADRIEALLKERK